MGEWWRRTSRGDRVRIAGAAVFVVLLAGGYVIQSHRQHRAPGRDDRLIPTTGAAADLTAVQIGHRPAGANAMLRRIDSLLELLEADCPADTRVRLAALTMQTIRSLGRDGISVRPNGVLGGVVGSTDIGSTASCSSFFAGYAERERRAAG